MNFSTPALGDPRWTEQEITGGPLDEGFQHYFGVGGSANFSPYIYIRDRNFTEIATERVEDVKHMFDGPKAAGYEADEVVKRTAEEAARYIQDLAAQDQPFFLYFALTSPHYPVVPHEDFIGSSGLEGPYGDFVVETDAAVGTVLQALTDSGEAGNTLIIFTADNGCARQADFNQLTSQGHNPSGGLRGGKQHIYEGGHRVPFVAAWPDRIEPGQVTNALVCLTDLPRTCATLVGADLPPDAAEDSFDMLPHLLGTPPTGPVRPDVVSHSAGGNFALQDDTWKLIFAKDGGYRLLTAYPNSSDWPVHEYDTFQLYNLQTDLSEFHNVYEDHPDIVQAFTEKMTQYVDQGRSTPGPAQQNHNGENRWKQVNWVE
jgi:arylsulfatase A-like enzyme